MSAIKTHDVWDVVHGDEVVITNEDGSVVHAVKSIMVDRSRPSFCQLFVERENTGSLSSRHTKVLSAKINTISPNTNTTDFAVNAKVGEELQTLSFKTVKNNNSECTIC
jgi:hypothetical protein